uniref:Uncharacterized protein n=1 Tax=Tanacetum cinerariifolium TaxID=118510 RepID=A0A6L2MKE9_TANCI|nr:hypothetical protein [Tanacetum cinerariifolium]
MSNTNANLHTQTSSVLHNDTVSLCLTSTVQEKKQLSRRGCMNSLREIKSQFKFLTETLHDFGTMPIFKRTFSQNLDLLEQHLTKEIISQTDYMTLLTKLRRSFENAFNLEFKERMQKYTRFDAQSFKDALIFLSKEDLKGTHIEHGFKQAFMSLFGQDVDTFTSTMLLNVDRLQKQLDKDELQDGSMTTFWVYDRRVNKRQMQTQESKIDMGKEVDADLVVTESSRTESEVQDDSNRSGNDTDADDVDIRPIYDEEPMAKCKLLAVGSPFFWQWEHPPLAVGTYTASGNSLLAVEMPSLLVNVKEVPTADMISMTSMIELESLFGPSFDEYFNGENQVVSKSFAITTADASDKRQQQPDSTSSTSALATTVTAGGNFDM